MAGGGWRTAVTPALLRVGGTRHGTSMWPQAAQISIVAIRSRRGRTRRVRKRTYRSTASIGMKPMRFASGTAAFFPAKQNGSTQQLAEANSESTLGDRPRRE